MTAFPAEQAMQVRSALREIIAEHGVQGLSRPALMSNLLKDLLPDAPGVSRMLVAAAEEGVADQLRDHAASGLDGPTATRLATSAFAARALYPREACAWLITEIAAALGLVGETSQVPTIVASSPAPASSPGSVVSGHQEPEPTLTRGLASSASATELPVPSSQSAGPAEALRPAPARPAATGVWLATVAAVTEIAAAIINGAGTLAAITALEIVLFAVPLGLAIAAMSHRRYRPHMLSLIQGIWWLAAAWVCFDAVGLPAFRIGSLTGRPLAGFAVQGLGDALGLVAVALLAISANRNADKLRRPVGRPLPAIVLGVAVLYEIIRLVTYFKTYRPLPLIYPDFAYPYRVDAIVSVLVVAGLAWCALSLRNRTLGGLLFLGWLFTATVGCAEFIFGEFRTVGEIFSSPIAGLLILQAILLFAELILVLAYLRGRALLVPSG